MEVATTRLDEKILKEIDFLSKEKQMGRATFLRNLIVDALEIERKKSVLRLYKERKISLEKASSMLKVDIVKMIDIIKEEGMYLDYTIEELEDDMKGLR